MIETMLLTGANNHDWKRSAPFFKKLLEDTGHFRVDLTEDPSGSLGDRSALGRYGLFFLDYNGESWSDDARTNFIEAVREGIGVTILHASDNAFPGWVAYEEMCGVCWREGSAHGRFHEFDVKIIDPDHPVTRDLPNLKDHPDELYHNLHPQHGAPYHILATAYSDPATGGSGKDEPMVVVKTFGQGRIFHDILGHVWEGGDMSALEDPQFQNLLIRGCEWAATGEVTG